MKLVRVDIRFFKSFNYDFELKSRVGSQPREWEETSPAWYPFVRVPLEGDITAVVGANEAGKSQLLTAIKAGLVGSPIERADFCRYSDIYSVKQGEIRLPEFGVTLEVTEGELDDLPGLTGVQRFTLVRPGSGSPFLVVDGRKVAIATPDLEKLQRRLPKFHELQTNLSIPDSVPIRQLAGKAESPLQNRSRRMSLLEKLIEIPTPNESSVGKVVLKELERGTDDATRAAEATRLAEFELARKLLVDIAKVDATTFEELEAAISSEREGQVAAIVGGINAAIRENLNIQRWWTQDRDFDLLVEAREHELAFAIRDRTAAKYSFGERSQGLRFFLSYFVQLQAHRLLNSKADILLLDEPDAFLSSVGQQDLLRVLEDYALPEDGGTRSQVVYVTHSPFLIDKNSPHRIRVLDKGSDDEGTRVVKDAAKNRYEPLRSSLGAYVSETAFIGGQNLFVEGAADQILIAGLATHLALRNGTSDGLLNLNDVTVVASGGADGIPYLVYLARGRDTVKPACVALLDGDEAGKRAEKVLREGEARKKRILNEKYVIRIDTWASSAQLELENGVSVVEIEDLLPLPLAQRAALNFLARFRDLESEVPNGFTVEAIAEGLGDAGGRVWKAVSTAFASAFPGEHLEKGGLAREVVTLIAIDQDAPGAEVMRKRFSALLAHLGGVLNAASAEEDHARTDDRLKRVVKNFTRDHTTGIKKVAARKILLEIESALGDTPFADKLRPQIHSITREFELENLTEPTVQRFDEFRERIRAFSTSERIAYQDDATRDPSSALLNEVSAAPDGAAALTLVNGVADRPLDPADSTSAGAASAVAMDKSDLGPESTP